MALRAIPPNPAYGDVAKKGANGLWRERFSYGSGGRLWRSTAGDGMVKLYLYDRNGSQTLQRLDRDQSGELDEPRGGAERADRQCTGVGLR